MQVSRRGWFLSVCVVILALANVSVYRAALAPRALKVSVLNVGEKGNATLVRTPGGRTVLVNTGQDAGVLRALGGALPLWQRRIDAIILTGTKATLAGGLSDVERHYRVGAIVRAGDSRVPYGAALVFDGARMTIISSVAFVISYGATSLAISSTTPAGVYLSDGEAVVSAK